MYDELRNHVEVLFEDVPKTAKAINLKEEIITNIEARYEDVLSNGASENDAFMAAVNSIGDIDELLNELRSPKVFDEEAYARERQKTAKFVTAAAALYFLAVAAGVAVFEFTSRTAAAGLLFFVIAAVASCLLIYHFTSRPKYRKHEDTIVEEFKQWSSETRNTKALHASISVIVWALLIVFYFLISFMTFAWHLTWMIFLIGIVAEVIITLSLNFNAPKNSSSGTAIVVKGNTEETETERFKKSVKLASYAILWAIAIAAYLLISFATGAWYITWLIAPAALCLHAVITLVINFKIK